MKTNAFNRLNKNNNDIWECLEYLLAITKELNLRLEIIEKHLNIGTGSGH